MQQPGAAVTSADDVDGDAALVVQALGGPTASARPLATSMEVAVVRHCFAGPAELRRALSEKSGAHGEQLFESLPLELKSGRQQWAPGGEVALLDAFRARIYRGGGAVDTAAVERAFFRLTRVTNEQPAAQCRQ
jgi:hypothetical protein